MSAIAGCGVNALSGLDSLLRRTPTLTLTLIFRIRLEITASWR
ncbi:hypothetical protein ACNKHT_19590 [Shigella flexneri]